MSPVKAKNRYIKLNTDIAGQINGGGMEGRLIGLLLVAVGGLASPIKVETDTHGPGQAISYAHVVRDHGTPTPYRVSKGFPSHESHVNNLQNSHYPSTSNQDPYSHQQSYPLSYSAHVPYTVGVPVAVPINRPYKVNVPKPFPVPVERPYAVPVERPYPYPVEYPVAAPVSQGYYEGKSYDETYEPQSEEQDEADYSGSAEED